MAMKGYSTFSRLQDWSLTIRCSLVSWLERLFLGGGSYPFADPNPNSTAPADWGASNTPFKKIDLVSYPACDIGRGE